MFAMELCRLLRVEPPQPSRGKDTELNDHCFERGVQFKKQDGSTAPGRIDLYKRSFDSDVERARLEEDRHRVREEERAAAWQGALVRGGLIAGGRMLLTAYLVVGSHDT